MANLSGNTDFLQSVILSPVFSIVGRGTTGGVLQAYFTTSLKAKVVFRMLRRGGQKIA